MKNDLNRLLRAVIDTNVFVSGLINRNSVPGRVVQTYLLREFDLVMSDQQQHELLDVLYRPAISRLFGSSLEVRDKLVSELRSSAILVENASTLNIGVRDPKDVPILASAVVGHADYLVTGDNDLLVLRDDPAIGNLRIVTPREFVEIMEIG